MKFITQAKLTGSYMYTKIQMNTSLCVEVIKVYGFVSQ